MPKFPSGGTVHSTPQLGQSVYVQRPNPGKAYSQSSDGEMVFCGHVVACRYDSEVGENEDMWAVHIETTTHPEGFDVLLARGIGGPPIQYCQQLQAVPA